MGARPLEPKFGIRLRVEILLRPSSDGGRDAPLVSGYRSLCVVEKPGGRPATIGMCELECSGSLQPGSAGEGVLGFSPEVSNEVEALLPVGASFALAEGRQVIGTATVRALLA